MSASLSTPSLCSRFLTGISILRILIFPSTVFPSTPHYASLLPSFSLRTPPLVCSVTVRSGFETAPTYPALFFYHSFLSSTLLVLFSTLESVHSSIFHSNLLKMPIFHYNFEHSFSFFFELTGVVSVGCFAPTSLPP